MPRPKTVSLKNPQIEAMLRAGRSAKEISFEMRMGMKTTYNAIGRLDWQYVLISPEERVMILQLRKTTNWARKNSAR